MLKDLEQRNKEPENAQVNYVPAVAPQASKKNIFYIIIVLLAINIVGIIMWQLYSENQSLKVAKAEKPATVVSESVPSNNQNISTQNESRIEDTIVASTPVKTAQVNQETAAAKLKQSEQSYSTQKHSKQALNEQAQTNQSTKQLANTAQITNTQESLPDNVATKPQQAKKESASLPPASEPVNNSSAKESTVVKKPTLTVTRRQLSSKEMADRKLTKAEQAVAKGDLSTAETLFEDILLLEPRNKFARKKLAALWFGRKSYQSAVNLLAQGISYFPDDSEFRVMQARVFLAVNNAQNALASLKPMADFQDKEYQVLLAGVAQELGDFETAIQAYQHLTKMVANNGRYWLGLAIAQDSNGQYQQAKDSYQSALAVGDLAKSSTDFATLRLQELGE